MNDGWAVVVRTERLGGGMPSYEIFWVAEPVALDAENLIKGLCTSDQHVVAAKPVSGKALSAMEIAPGKYLVAGS